MDGDSINTQDEPLDDDLYTPLQRVTNIASQSSTKPTTDELEDYIDSPSCESDADPDSDNQSQTKKLKVKNTLKPLTSADSKKKSYDIWSHIQEDALTESLGGCGVSQDLSRNVESYDYRQAQRFRKFSTESTDGNSVPKVSDDNVDCKSRKHKRKFRDRGNISLRLGKANSNNKNTAHNRINQRTLLDLIVTSEDTEDDIANDIASKLYEPKDSLILRAVKAIGKEKCVQLYYKTQKVEKDGGMTVVEGTRRRTPGGVFIFLMKHDNDIPKAQLKEVFIEDRKMAITKKKNSDKKKRKEDYKKFQRKMQEGAEGKMK
uniref:Phosphorylated adapter RNA export protein n=1 Tax=Xenopsylla cheopis TaxID=163159 RepID=A0A6M2DFT4_XENCH